LKVLVTGGAGFIGSYIVDNLIEQGYDVVVYDNLEPQVHGKEQKIPEYLNKKADFIKGDIRDAELLKKCLSNIDIIFHQAALVGVGQSMYRMEDYVDVNTKGTATLLQTIISLKKKPVKVIVASSMSIYGEGNYKCENCNKHYTPFLRIDSQLKSKNWEYKCSKCNSILVPVKTPETKPLFPTSVYAITKRDQEELILSVLRAYNIPAVALRYFNVYGARQSLSNPYTGVLAIFISRLLNNAPPVIFEDGNQTRDFIHVKDIAKANILAMESEQALWKTYNVGTGRPTSINQVADILIKDINNSLKKEIKFKYRAGDIRHCFADITRIKEELGFEPSISFDEGIKSYIEFIKQAPESKDMLDQAIEELEERGLTL